MKCLGDENLEAEYVAWLRATGHDVLWACETRLAANDPYWLQRGFQERRVFVTSDLDFGKLVILQQRATVGVILLRLHQTEASLRLTVLKRYWPTIEHHCPGHIIVVTENKLRIKPIE